MITNMKKFLLFAMGAMMSATSFAQEEDVTHYIQNAGFDEDLTWQADGSTKPIVSTTKEFSNRSFAYEAEDGTVYAYGRGSRSDGAKPAWNGFFGQIKGWTPGDKAYTGKSYYPIGTDAAEWVYFGSVPYDLGAKAIPIADDGTTFLSVPQKPAADSGDDNKAFIYLRAGWGGAATYKQTVKLPCAVYRLEYWAINTNPGASKGKNLSRVVCRKDEFKDETGFNDTEWTLHEIEFTPTAEFSMEFGFQSEGGSGSNPFLCIDGIKLYKIGEADPDEILRSDINEFINECDELSGRAASEGFYGLSAYIADYSLETLEDYLIESGDALEAAAKAAEERMKDIRKAIEEMENVNAVLAKMDNLMQSTSFPGKADLETAYNKILNYKQNQSYEGDIVASILAATEEANTAIKAYYLSQQDSATEENPADFSIFVKNPWFIKTIAEPTLVDGEWIFPKADTYTEGSTNDDLTNEGWTVTGTYTGGDQRLNWQRGRSCWNAWGSGITGTIAVGQTLENLPNGYYTVSADLITQSGCLTDQHTYAQSTSEKKIASTTLSIEGWDENMWETVSMSATDKVLVVDGKLTIGAEGTGTGSGSAGWFLATNFKLNFLGKASDADIEAAIANSYTAKLTEANEFVSTMHFALDKQALSDSIAKYNAAADKETKLEAISALTLALTEAQKSEAKYVEYFQEGKTLPTIADKLAAEGEEGYGEAKEIAQFAYDYAINWINGAEGTYNKIDSIVNHTKDYVNTYVPVYQEAAQVAAAAKETGKNVLVAAMNAQKTALLAEMKETAFVNECVNALKELMNVVKKQNIWEDENANDYTAFIINPNLEAEDGWTFERGNGDKNSTQGQWFDGSNTRYIDSYHSTNVTDEETGETTHTGLIGFKGSQLVKDLPNGTYTVGAYTRTPAEGAYIFAGVADTTFVEIPLSYYNEEIASDNHGPMWDEAEQKIVNEGLSEDDPTYAYWNAIYNANNGSGRGWKHQEIENIVVTNHELFIGTMAGTEASKTEKVFGGDWYSVGGWTLTLVSKGDNTGWNGPIASGIEATKAQAAATEGIYTLTGVKANKLQRGMNIIIRNGKATKVFVK